MPAVHQPASQVAQPHANFIALRGFTRLAFDGVERMTRLVEAMHSNIARRPWPFGHLQDEPTRGITGFVYSTIRGTTSLIREAVDATLGVAQPLLPATDSGSAGHEAWQAAVNGVLGDHLAATGNPLAIPMRFRHQGRALELNREALADALPEANGKLLVLVHGLCMNDLQWTRQAHNHGAALAQELGYTPVYLHYNSGRHISTNGREFSALLENLLTQWPVKVKSLTLLTHSLGGLVTRSACHYAEQAGHGWLRSLRQIVFLGTPHHGAPLERHGNKLQLFVGLSPYTAPLARLGMLRSAGVTDLRYGNLLDQDWQEGDRFAPGGDHRQIVSMPEGVQVYAAAATLGQQEGGAKDRWFADGLVPLYSALGRHRDPARHLDFPSTQQWVGYDMSHWELLDSQPLYAQIRDWLGGDKA